MALAPGHRLGSYEIVSALGAGGMGEVYRARDARLGREVALKVLPPEMTGEAGRLDRFDREARAIAALNHPHIVTIYSTEEADGLRFLTMELVEGCTLSDLVVGGGMALPRFLDIAMPLADALAAAHQKHITHRDLKPGNVMVSHDHRVKVLDFGLARIGGGDGGEQTLIATQAPITHQGTIVGTMPYMSPEQVEGRPLDARTDLFSLGVIFYELLSGARPFKGGSSAALMSAILRDTPPPLAGSRHDIPEMLDRLVARLIEKRPEDRVQTARDVHNELRHLRRQLESGTVRSASSGIAPAVPDTLSIAVLPFLTRTADPDAEALAAGVTEDVATGLAKFAVLSVVAAQATRRYKDSPLDVRQIAEHAGARYVVTGIVRKSARTIRTTAQLIDAQSGAQLWSESYDRDAAAMDLFAIQDDLTDHIVATLADTSGVLARSMVKSVRTQLPAGEQTSRELMLRAWALVINPNPADHADLRSAIEGRVALEPDNADLWAELAQLYLVEHILLANTRSDALARSLRAARRAVEIDPQHQRGWTELAADAFFMRDRAALEHAVEKAVQINPRNASALGWLGNLLAHAGQAERGAGLTERAMAINPRHAGWLHFGPFIRHFAAGNYAEALAAARRVNSPHLVWSHFATAAAAAHLGLSDEARQAADRVFTLTPPLANPEVLRAFTEMWYWQSAVVEALLDGLNKARSGVHDQPRSSASGPLRADALSVAVLPFVARSSDDESASLADGLTDDITSGLSRFGYLRVLSRSIAERLAREHTQVHTQARYAIEGHVRRSGSAVRVGVTLVDTQTANNLWTQNYDREAAAGTFAVQDDVSSAAVATIGDQTGVLVRAIAAAIADRPIDALTVAELVIRYHLYTEQFSPDEHRRLREAFERTLERDPRAADGWACLSLLYEQEHAMGLNQLPDALGRQRRAAERAIEMDPSSQQAWVAMASMYYSARDREGLKGAVERAVRVNPLNADMVALVALFASMAGEYDRAFELVRQAEARKPQHAGWYYHTLFHYHYVRGEYDAGMRAIKAVNMPRMPLSHLGAAAVSGQLGRAADAKAALDAVRRINPALADPGAARAAWSIYLWDQTLLDRLVDGLGKAIALEVASDPGSSASIAVLPFTDLSEKKDQDWFCDGIAEEILNALSPLPGLRVAARASAFSFRGKTDDLRAIGEKLNVGTVLEGSVRRAGDRVRITTQLSDTRQGRQLWSERFDRELEDIFDVQEEIARAIVDRLRVSITGGSAPLVPRATTNLEAYQLLLQGRTLVTRRGRAVLDAIRLFERAIALDPNLSEAHALLGDAYRLLGFYGVAPASEVMPRARACVERALAVDPNQAEALATLAIIATVYEWDIDAFRARSDRALAAEPLHVRANAERGMSLAVLGLPGGGWEQESLAHVRKARALDPLNAWVMAIEAGCVTYASSAQEAVAIAKGALALDQNNFTAHWIHVSTLAEAGREDEALAACPPALAMSGRHTMILTNMAAIHDARGELDQVEAIRQELRERAATTYIGSSARALVAAAAGDWLEARAFLARAIEEHDPWVAFWKLYSWRPIWKDEQCTAMIKATSLFRRPGS